MTLRGYPMDPMHTGYGRIPDPAEFAPDEDVCEHGEIVGDCDWCEHDKRIDAYDEGLLDDR